MESNGYNILQGNYLPYLPYKSKASFCKDQDGNMVTDIKSSLELWRAHFNATLNGDDTNNPENEMIRPSMSNTLDNTTPLVPPDR